MADTSKINLGQLKTALIQAKNYTDNEIASVTVSKVEPEELDMPKVFFNGDKPTNKTSVYATIEYISKTEHFKGYVDIKCQGTSSMAYPKKNYTIKMFSDETRSTKLKKDFKGWGKQSKFCLKANYIDHSHARNIVSAKLWGQVVKSRSDFDTLPEELKTSPNYGAVDGFPIKVYYNGTYDGVYTWNIPKDGWMNNMDDKLDTHCILCGEEYNSGCFRSANASAWSDELHDTMPANIVTSFNNFQHFVINSSDDEFKTGLSTYADINSLIDYYIFQYVICGLDSMGKNQLFFTYDGIKWIASSYDMDSTFGLYWNGRSFVSATYRMQEDYESMANGRPGNLLYMRMEQLFCDEIKARYAELRAGVLSYANIVNEFERFMDTIGKDLFAEDLTIYTGIPSGSTNNIQQIRNYTRDRLTYVDTQIEALRELIPCTGIVLSADTLSFTTTDTQTLSVVVSPDNTTDAVNWSVSPSGIATVNNGVVTPVTNGECTITATCGSYSDTCSVTVSLPIIECTGITLDQDTLTIDASTSTTAQLTATVTPENCTQPVVWSVSPEGIVTANNGLVTAVANGEATVTATCGTQSATCAVTVSGMSESGGDSGENANYLANASWQYGTINKDIPGMSTSTADRYTTIQIPAGKYALRSTNATYKKYRLKDSEGTVVYYFMSESNTNDLIIDTSMSDDTIFTLEVSYYKPNDTIEVPSLVTTTETNITTITLDGSLSYSIANWSANPSGENGQVNAEIIISGITSIPSFHNLKGYTHNINLPNLQGVGKPKQYRISSWNNVVYLSFTLDMTETGVTNDVESITNYLSSNPLTFKYVYR